MKSKAVSGIMLTLLLIGVLTLAFNIQQAEAAEPEPPETEWTRTYGGTKCDEGECVVETSDGGYALAGRTESSGAGKFDFWLVKVDSSGNVQWNRTYGGGDGDVARCVVVTADGGYALAGWTRSFGAGVEDFWLIKVDSSGGIEWSKTYGGTKADVAECVVQTSDRGYALAGYTLSFEPVGIPNAWLVKVDSSGNEQWNKTYGGAGSDSANSVVQTSDGGYALAGSKQVTVDGHVVTIYEFWLVKVDSSGNEQWNKTYGGGFAHSVVETDDGGYALAGRPCYGDPPIDWDALLVKVDSSGNMEWNKTYGGANDDTAYSVVETSDGGYALAGYTNSSGAGICDVWLVKTDANGNVEWNKTYGGTFADWAVSVVQTENGGYALAGTTYSFGAGGGDFWLVKAAPELVRTTVTGGGGGGYTILIECNVTITDAIANPSTLSFTTSGPAGGTGYINVTLPVGLNKTEIKVFIDGEKLIPPPFPVIDTNGTHYFIYFEFTLSTHEITIEYSIPGDANGDGMVNVWDLGLLSDAWLTESGQPDYDPNCDFNMDNVINVWDLGIMSDYWLCDGDEWVSFVPSSGMVNLEFWMSNGISYVNASITFFTLATTFRIGGQLLEMDNKFGLILRFGPGQ